MGIKWPQAENLRNAVDRHLKERVSRPQVAEFREKDHQDYPYGDSAHSKGFVRELLSFSGSMRPRMAMIDLADPIPKPQEIIGDVPLL